MRVVIDTNVFVSGIFWNGPSYKILQAWKDSKIKLILSQEILEEYIRVFEYLSLKYKPIDLTPFLELVTIYGEFCDPNKLSRPVSIDPDDDKFIECALEGKAGYIVSGDNDLLNIREYMNIKILTPRKFIEVL